MISFIIAGLGATGGYIPCSRPVEVMKIGVGEAFIPKISIILQLFKYN